MTFKWSYFWRQDKLNVMNIINVTATSSLFTQMSTIAMATKSQRHTMYKHYT